MDNVEGVEVLKTFNDLQQLEGFVSNWGVHKPGNSYQHRPRGVRVRLEILHDVAVIAPVIDESELEHRHVDTMKWENVLVRQPSPYRHEFPKDLLCFLKILRGVNAECFEGHLLAAPSPSPNIGGPSRSNGDFPGFLEPLKQSDGAREQSGAAGDISQCSHKLRVLRSRSLFVAVGVRNDLFCDV